jgi:DNA-binding Xre family transcriptional regulator
MFQLKIKNLMQERGILRPYNQLIKIGIGRNTAAKMLNGSATSITLPHLYKLCMYLNCTPKELIVLTPQTEDHYFESHPLKDWIEKPTLVLVDEIAQLSPTEIETMKAFLREMKGRKEN